MAGKSTELTLDYTAEALADLDGIWEWNAEQRGADHADRYLAFLREWTDKLARTEKPGKPVPTSDCYRYATIKWKSRGHGHVAVFEISGQMLRILRYFHTAQDWEKKIAEG